MTRLKLWHAWVAGGFLVAYLTADEDTYSMHLFAGYAVLAAVAVRVAMMAPWPLVRPGRHKLFGWLAVALLVSVGAGAITGALADLVPWLEDPHEAVAEASLWVIGAHVAFVAYMYGGKRLMRRFALAALLLGLPLAAQAGDIRRDPILANYAAEIASFAGFSAARGETLFRTRWAGGDDRAPSCTACHTESPRNPGRNAKTGRPIEPVAVSVNPARFTDPAEIEKQFGRDCKTVLGRACTAQEKGDYITFMMGQ